MEIRNIDCNCQRLPVVSVPWWGTWADIYCEHMSGFNYNGISSGPISGKTSQTELHTGMINTLLWGSVSLPAHPGPSQGILGPVHWICYGAPTKSRSPNRAHPALKFPLNVLMVIGPSIGVNKWTGRTGTNTDRYDWIYNKYNKLNNALSLHRKALDSKVWFWARLLESYC